MLTSAINSIRENKAKLARDVEYLKETALDDRIDERVMRAEACFEKATLEEYQEAAGFVDRLSSENDLVEESMEVERILKAEGDLTFNEMAGI